MIVELTSPYGELKAEVLISEETGRTTLSEGEGGDLEVACQIATEQVHGGIEPWVPPLEWILDWCERRNIAVRIVGQPERAPVDPDLVY